MCIAHKMQYNARKFNIYFYKTNNLSKYVNLTFLCGIYIFFYIENKKPAVLSFNHQRRGDNTDGLSQQGKLRHSSYRKVKKGGKVRCSFCPRRRKRSDSYEDNKIPFLKT